MSAVVEGRGLESETGEVRSRLSLDSHCERVVNIDRNSPYMNFGRKRESLSVFIFTSLKNLELYSELQLFVVDE